MPDKELIRKNFSRSAENYEKHAVLQKALADSIYSYVSGFSAERILDIGCGTGYLTRRLAKKFPQVEVIGIDIAPGMIEVAVKNAHPANLRYEIGDGEGLNFGQNSFDLIVSNASLQWMEAEKVFSEIQRVLRPCGQFFFNTFGPGTLRELRESGFRVNKFLSADELRSLLRERLKINWLVSAMAEQKFKSMKDLLYHLKEIGAQAADSEGKTEKKLFRQYREKFSSESEIIASYEIISGGVSSQFHGTPYCPDLSGSRNTLKYNN